jgi:LmbE family N-acetylglucosaminyl deacetylase
MVCAHPDDESLWAGGTLAQHVRLGDDVVVTCLADGVGSRFREGDPIEDVAAAIDKRRQDFYHAMTILGARGYWASVFHDQQADQVSLLTITDSIRSYFKQALPPDLVYTHHVGDLNLDHRRVAEAVLVCTRGGPTVRCMTPEWPQRCVGPRFEPNIQVELTPADRMVKVRACACYGEELRAWPHPRSIEAMQRQTAEVFQLVNDQAP